MTQSLVENQGELCAVCGIASSVTGTAFSDHHVIWKSRGGADGPTIRLCARCHSHANGEKTGEPEWDVTEYSETKTVVVARRTGEVVAERWNPPEGFDEGLFIAELAQAPRYLEERAEQFKYLSDDGLLTVAETLVDLENTSWMVRALLGITMRLRSPYGDTTRLVQDVAQRTGISKTTFYKEMGALELMRANPELFPLTEKWTPDAVGLALDSSDPVKAAALFTPESPRQFRRILAENGLAKEPDSHECPLCGQIHHIKNLMPVSDMLHLVYRILQKLRTQKEGVNHEE